MAGVYDPVAAEYYNTHLHPTCHNFNRLSRKYFDDQFKEPPTGQKIVEVGSGESTVAALLHARGCALDCLEITDGSSEMLRHSLFWKSFGAQVRVAAANELYLKESSISILVAGLCDPYNTREFWKQVSNILTGGGKAIVTLPSFEWAVRYRTFKVGGALHEAEFTLSDGRVIALPSYIFPLAEQIKLIEDAGLVLTNFANLGLENLGDDKISSKVQVFGDELSSIIWGITCTKVIHNIGQKIRNSSGLSSAN